MRVMGAVLAGGRSRRFGSDKAIALLDGIALIDRVTQALADHVHEVVIVGREPGIADIYADIGPVGGIATAMRYADGLGYDAVITVPCDTPILSPDLFNRLKATGAPAYLDRSPVIGIWPVELIDAIDRHIADVEDRSVRAWTKACSASVVHVSEDIPNINTPADLNRLSINDP